MKKLIALVMLAAMTLSLVACGDSGSIDESAAIREFIQDDSTVYIDDEYTALVGSLDSGATEAEIARSAELAQKAREAFELANQQRIAVGLPAYVWSNELAIAAQVRAKEIVTTFSHTRPDGSSYWTVNSQLVYGENLARGYNSAASAVDGWMNSPTHRANILDTTLVTVGIAIYEDASGKLYWAQEFGY